jgi:TonB family protein
MQMLRTITQLITISLLLSVTVLSQSTSNRTQRFTKDDLSFDYPEDWKLMDKSNPQAQHLILTSGNSSALIMIIAYRDLIGLPEQLTAARREITEPFIDDTAQKLGGANVKREQVQINVGSVEANGVRLHGAINKEPGTAEVYSFTEKLRFINLVYIRANKHNQLGEVAWENVRRSLKLETPVVGYGPDESGQKFLDQELRHKALKLLRPDRPIAERQGLRISTVAVRVIIDENGDVIEAKAVSGYGMFRPAAVKAARGAKFTPTRIYGQPVKATGLITYRFL